MYKPSNVYFDMLHEEEDVIIKIIADHFRKDPDLTRSGSQIHG